MVGLPLSLERPVAPLLDLVELAAWSGRVIPGPIFIVEQPLGEVTPVLGHQGRSPSAQLGTSSATSLPLSPDFFRLCIVYALSQHASRPIIIQGKTTSKHNASEQNAVPTVQVDEYEWYPGDWRERTEPTVFRRRGIQGMKIASVADVM
jgi:hypothetical protein